MTASLVERPRLAIATAVAIVAGVVIVAALFAETTSVAEIPERGDGVEDLWGRKFVAVEATEGGRPYQLPEEQPLSATFDLGGSVTFELERGEFSAYYHLEEGRLDWRNRPPTNAYQLPEQPVHATWVEDFLAERPAWRLDGNTLQLSSDFGTMTLVDKGEGTKPSELLGERFIAESAGTVDDDSEHNWRANTWVSLSFDTNGTLRVKFGCESAVVPAEVRTGWFRITAALRPTTTTDCSRSMAAQETAWLWEFLQHPVRFQAHRHSRGVTLKAHGSDHELLGIIREKGPGRRTGPDLLAGKTFYGAPKSSIYGNAIPMVIEIGENGEFNGSSGCEQPSVHGTFRTGWIQFGENLEWSLAACEDSAEEQWLGDFLAHEPSWYLVGNGELIVRGGRHYLGLAEAEDYENIYGEPPTDGGVN